LVSIVCTSIGKIAMLPTLLILTLSLCFWILTSQLRQREESSHRRRALARQYPHTYKRVARDPEEQYIEGVGYIIGDSSCKYNARSLYVRCAVNPSGLCEGCHDYYSQ
jgi:Family of unknown function (DUF6464)